ncbi:tetratricopeptide repeat protein [Flavobacteriaceae bacterium 3-367]
MKFWKALFVFCIPFFSLGQQEVLIKVDHYLELKKYEEAEMALLRAANIRFAPGLMDKLGEVYGLQGKWDKAIGIYEELTDTYPQNPEYQFRYGGVLARKAQNSSKLRALMLLGRIKEGFTKAVELNPNHIEARWALVDLYVSIPGIVGGSTSKAYKYARELKAISPFEGYLALGYVCEYDDEPLKAELHYKRALSYLSNLGSVPRNQLNYQIGKVCSDYGIQLEKGIQHMGAYINNFTVKDGVPLYWAYYRMAKLYRHQGAIEQASSWVEKALADRPTFKPALEEREVIRALL